MKPKKYISNITQCQKPGMAKWPVEKPVRCPAKVIEYSRQPYSPNTALI